MILVYVDESGINYKKDVNSYFKDGPYILWNALFISDNKYLSLERDIYDISKDILGIKDLGSQELKGSKIWSEAQLNKKKKKIALKYFDELFQLISKHHLQISIGIQQKNPQSSSEEQQTELL